MKLIAIDMDATLLRDDKTFDVARFRRVVTQLLAQGTRVCIASGNIYLKLKTYFDDSLVDQLIFAAANGNDCLEGGRVVRRSAMSIPLVTALIEALDEFEGFYPMVSTDLISYTTSKHQAAIDYFARYTPNMVQLDSISEITPELGEALQVPVMSQRTLQENKVMVRILNERFPEIRTVTSGGKWLDIFNHHGGKEAAIRYFQQQYGWDPAECMAIGDSMNDRMMMHEVAYSVAMGNADADLVSECRYQIGNNNDQAVIDLLEALVADPTAAFMAQYQIKRHSDEDVE